MAIVVVTAMLQPQLSFFATRQVIAMHSLYLKIEIIKIIYYYLWPILSLASRSQLFNSLKKRAPHCYCWTPTYRTVIPIPSPPHCCPPVMLLSLITTPLLIYTAAAMPHYHRSSPCSVYPFNATSILLPSDIILAPKMIKDNFFHVIVVD